MSEMAISHPRGGVEWMIGDLDGVRGQKHTEESPQMAVVPGNMVMMRLPKKNKLERRSL